jgi:hypothetical protein
MYKKSNSVSSKLPPHFCANKDSKPWADRYMKKEDVLTRDCHDKPAVLSDYAWDRLAISSKCFVFDLSVPNTIVLSIKVHLLKPRPFNF